ncbi:flagellar biosynthesis anti-sigma factor FlgM [Robertmurraya massiliosenegalensis]|uniref:flagellar biosynthesis anti-sigma factor FlgM n=1 Tax=Robertmurraya TaxID=2837507 RepID=UPI0039A4F198
MKINPLRSINVNPYNKQAEKIEPTQKAKGKDKVEISTEAMKLQKLGNIELERQEKVDAIKKEVQSGNYEVNAKVIAEKMYSFWD